MYPERKQQGYINYKILNTKNQNSDDPSCKIDLTLIEQASQTSRKNKTYYPLAQDRRIHRPERIRIKSIPQPHKPRNSRRKKTKPQLRRTKNQGLRHTKKTHRIRTSSRDTRRPKKVQPKQTNRKLQHHTEPNPREGRGL